MVDFNVLSGDIEDLINSRLLLDEKNMYSMTSTYDHSTWTFYKLSTIKGSVTFRRLGTSKGYCSKSIDLHEVTYV